MPQVNYQIRETLKKINLKLLLYRDAVEKPKNEYIYIFVYVFNFYEICH